MLPEENTFICRNCGLEKSVIAEKQRFLAEKGYDRPPMFCEACITARLDQIWEAPGEKRLASCTDCGCETRLSFVPCKELPVYCPECFKKHRAEA
jgi:CxxC-x17-CxxC domain-containing protein